MGACDLDKFREEAAFGGVLSRAGFREFD